MKFALILPLVSLLLASAALAQPVQQIVPPDQAADGVYRVVELGAHHKTWQRIVEVQDESGFLQTRTNSYVEISGGMNVWSELDQSWTQADDQIELFEGGAIARKTQHQAIFPANLNDALIEVVLPDKKRLRSRPVGLGYLNKKTGQSVFVSELRDSAGAVVGRNEVLYPQAFGQLADVRYRTSKDSFEQDVLIRRKLPPPTDFQIAEEDAVVEVWTEFYDPPEPNKKTVGHAETVFELDEQLDFGENSMFFSASQAFRLEDGDLQPVDAPRRDAFRASKQWITIDSRTFLVESFPFASVEPLTANLEPLTAKITPDKQALKRLASAQSTGRRLKPISLSAKAAIPSADRIASATMRRGSKIGEPAVVLDYVLANGENNFTFAGDTTFYATGSVWYIGTTTFEGAVIKYAPVNTPGASPRLMIDGSVVCKTSAYRPLTLTARDDDSVGEIIAESDGNPEGSYFAYEAVMIWDVGTAVDLHDLHVRHAYVGVGVAYRAQTQIRHAQFVNCFEPTFITLGKGTLSLQNVLCHNFTYGTAAWNATVNMENCTFNGGAHLVDNIQNSGSFNFVNCLVTAVLSQTSLVNPSFNRVLSSSSGVFQSKGAGYHYLADSTHRNAGTTAINGGLLADLKTKTTYPPIVITGNITVPTTLYPQAQRDNDTPDLGFHYDPLDWLLSEVTVSNASLLLTDGVAIGTYGTRGIYLGTGAKLVSEGLATNPNRLGHVNRVQEQPTLVAGTTDYAWLVVNSSGPPPPEIHLAFSDVSLLSGSVENRRLAVNAAYYKAPMTISDSYLRGVSADFYLLSAGAWTLTLRNNRFERYYLNFLQDSATYYPFSMEQRNNTFVNGQTYYTYSNSGTVWTVTDNLYDTDHLYRVGVFSAANNGYRSGLTAFVNDPAPKTGLVMDYQPGPMANHLGYLGNFYYPSSGGSTSLANLIDMGSRTSSQAGLTHHTVSVTAEVKDGGPKVDIGFHHVALNANNQPMDSDAIVGPPADGDGVPDYLEDRNGNGVFDPGDGTYGTGETDWQSLPPFTGFAAMDNVEGHNFDVNNLPVNAPDTMGAIGPNHFVQIVNFAIKVFGRDPDGTPVSSKVILTDFFAPSDGTPIYGTAMVDPRIIYDPSSQRWFASAMENRGPGPTAHNNDVILAVSENDNPISSGGANWYNTAWRKYRVRMNQWEKFLDFPTLGVDENGVYIAANYVIGIPPVHHFQSIRAIPKSTLFNLTGCQLGAGCSLPPLPDPLVLCHPLYASPCTPPCTSPCPEPCSARCSALDGTGAIQPVSNFDAIGQSDAAWFVRAKTPDHGNVEYLRLTWDALQQPQFDAQWQTVTTPAYENTGVAGVGDRLLMAIQRNGYIWTAHNVVLSTPNGIRYGSEWLKLQIVTSQGITVLQLADFGRVYDPNATITPINYTFPSIAVNSRGDAVMGFSAATTASPQAYDAYYVLIDPAGTMSLPRLLFSSGAKVFPFRTGDYSGSSLDPRDSRTFWTIQTYATTVEDIDGDGILDPGEDRNGNSVLDGGWGNRVSKIKPYNY